MFIIPKYYILVHSINPHNIYLSGIAMEYISNEWAQADVLPLPC